MKTMLVLLAMSLCLGVFAEASGAKRTGLIRVFAVTNRVLEDGRDTLTVKLVRDRRARPIGEVAMTCTRMPRFGGVTRFRCAGTLVMPLGRIEFSGVRQGAGYYVLAVTGGTGAYAGSTGSLTANTVSTAPRVEWLLVSLV